ncbi:BPSS1780 family membrane protein [Niveibacterium umoris]|uniref:BPSS1780 family membrane protein n=1 Tax=Niveibacterium umoris TaxID=1193620 RepID=UPI001619CD04
MKWITEAFSMVFAQLGTWMLIGLVMFVMMFVLFTLGNVQLLGMLRTVLMPVFLAGVIYAAARQEGGERVRVGDLFAGFREKFAPLALVGLLWSFIGIVASQVLLELTGIKSFMAWGPGVGLGLILLAFLFLLLLAPSFYALMWLAPALVLRHDLSPVEAMKNSFRITLRNSRAVIHYVVVGAIVMLIALIPFGLGLLIAFPVLLVSLYTAYRDLFIEP